MNENEIAYAYADTLGLERSARVRYQKAHDKQQKRIRDLEAALKPFSHPDLCKAFGGNIEGDESIVFQRAGAIMKLGHFRRAAAILKGA